VSTVPWCLLGSTVITRWVFARLTFFFCDCNGRTVAEQKVGPFQARLHKIKPVLPLPVVLPVEGAAPVNIQAPAPLLPCLCIDCVYRAMLHHPNG